MVDFPEAIPKFLPESYSFSTNAAKAIVIHKTGGNGTLDSLYNTFNQSMRSTHYGIGLDGTIWQFVPEARGAGGNCCVEAGYNPFWQPYLDQYKNLNLCTLSVEHCDPTLDNSYPMPQAQVDASHRLIAYWCKKYGIGVDHIYGHASLDPIDRSRCPGPTYDFGALFNYIQGGGSMSITIAMPEVAHYFKEIDSSHWQCIQTGCVVQGAILAFYQRYGGDALCGLTHLGLPTTNEVPVQGQTGVVEQTFERGKVAYDPQHTQDNPPGAGSVYLMHMPQVVQPQPLPDPRVALAVTDLTALLGKLG